MCDWCYDSLLSINYYYWCLADLNVCRGVRLRPLRRGPVFGHFGKVLSDKPGQPRPSLNRTQFEVVINSFSFFSFSSVLLPPPLPYPLSLLPLSPSPFHPPFHLSHFPPLTLTLPLMVKIHYHTSTCTAGEQSP